ncbi:MAG: amidohydrolase family protein [Polyangiaceae bacterium]|nr:amidohydrolase family protein [Polyangiaceae bacterium]
MTPGRAAAPGLVLRGGTVLTCDARSTVVRGDVLVAGGRIAALGRVRAPEGTRSIDCRDRLILPGLVLAHVHLCQTLFRGLASDLPLLEWLRRRVWPLEAAHDERSLRASAELGLSELLLAGVTTILDLGTVHDQDVVFDACVRAGIRVIGGKSLMDSGAGVPRRLREPTARALGDAERLAREWNGHPSGRVEHAWIPRFVLSCSERLVRGAVERARAAGAALHTHAAEHPAERAAVRAALGADDLTVLRRWGWRGPRASIAHGVQLRAGARRALARDGVGVVHCPSANLKLGSGIAQVAALRGAGVVVGLGADGAPCNDNLDPFVELRHAALLSSVAAGPGAMPAAGALALATRDGARLLGLEATIGSVEVGKAADLLVLRTDAPHLGLAPDPAAAVVYAAQARDVEHVLVGGEPVVAGAELQTLDAGRVVAVARDEQRRLRRRAEV